MRPPLLVTQLRADTDVLALRRAGREIARHLGLDTQDQVRVATALSEVGRAAVATGPADVTITLVAQGPLARLRAEVATGAPLPADGSTSEGGIPAARRLVDGLDLDAARRRVVLTKGLGAGARTDDATLAAVRRSVSAAHAADAHDELRVQNADLVRALDDLTEQQEQLRRVNAELEETNRGVLAMYDQLSSELEETNTGVVALYAELDERGRALTAANESKTRFLRNVSHELRTPVNSIIGLSSLLADSHLDAEQEQQVAFVRESAHTLLTLVDELLDLARAEAGHEDVDPTDVDVAELLEELRGTTLPLVRHGVVLEVAAPPGLRVVTDRRLLARVLRNLLTNAVKFTDAGHVRLTARADDRPGDEGGTSDGSTSDGSAADGASRGIVAFVVEDTGLGIPADQLEAVFDEFVQVPNRLQPTVKGTGLGLPYARRTVEALGGTLVAASDPGAGSTFAVRLPSLTAAPVADPPPRPRPRTPPRRPVGRRSRPRGRRRPGLRSVLVSMLRDTAARVSVAHDATHALALLRDAAADAVLLDVRMPGTDGLTVLGRIAQQNPGMPVVLMSSGPPPRQPADRTPVPFLPKSAIDRETLVATLRRETSP
ncbi:ATP-binding protein [Cellulosimicrobium sp. CUA-896]|uniref:ATP-binding protein n=1 Tax=Cellulosimicrobium sp. CUA-896 TaxID=1517881 RepID=UPI000B1D53F1|nr:ATP-binding protein [Cellulosimicrobium sp. CUA-896]